MRYLLGVIGHPIKHSLSPWIHEQFLKQTNLEGIYRAIDVPAETFASTMDTFKRMDVDGFNVTVPYKQKIIDYLDYIDPLAEKIGAVNTVVNKNGKWTGYNTDGLGYIRSLKETYPDTFKNKSPHILMIGAGGAARGIYGALNEGEFPVVDIANRTVEKIAALKTMKHPDTSTKALSLNQAEENLHRYDIIIQTTNIGLHPKSEDSPITVGKLKSGAIASDIIYNPMDTKFLKDAKEKGAQIHHGHGMLLYQAALAFELWTQTHVDATEMLDRLAKEISK